VDVQVVAELLELAPVEAAEAAEVGAADEHRVGVLVVGEPDRPDPTAAR